MASGPEVKAKMEVEVEVNERRQRSRLSGKKTMRDTVAGLKEERYAPMDKKGFQCATSVFL